MPWKLQEEYTTFDTEGGLDYNHAMFCKEDQDIALGRFALAVALQCRRCRKRGGLLFPNIHYLP